MRFDGRDVALGYLHGRGGLLRGSLRLRDASFGLLDSGVCLLAFLRRLCDVENADCGLVRALNVKGDLLLRFRQIVGSLRLG